MLSVRLVALAGFIANAISTKVLNVNWKCNDGAPCLNVVRPRGGFGMVNADKDSYKLEVSVHRPEGARERLLKKWSSSSGTTWNVDVSWFRLMEEGVQLSMQQCSYKLVCVVPLLDDEAMARSDETSFDTGLTSHHFLVSVKYEGHKATSQQEIIIERQGSDQYEEYRPPGNSLVPPPSPQQKQGLQQNSETPKNPNAQYPDLQEFVDNKKQKATQTLIKSGLYSGSDEPNMIPSLYEVKDTPDMLHENSDPFNINSQDSRGSASDDGVVVVHSKNETAHAASTDVKGFIADMFLRLGPTATVIILLAMSILMACLCACGYNRAVQKYHASGTNDYVKLRQEQSVNSPREQARARTPLKSNPPSDDKKSGGTTTSWFWSKRKPDSNNTTPSVSAGIQEKFATYSKAVGKFLSSVRGGDEAENQTLLSDSDDDEGGSKFLGIGEKIKKTGSGFLEQVKSNERFQRFKTRIRESPYFFGGKNEAETMEEGRYAMGKTNVGWSELICERLLQCVTVLLCPFTYIYHYTRDCYGAWRRGKDAERLDKKNTNLREFMPSRGPLNSTSSSDDSSSDEVNVYRKESERKGKNVSFSLKHDRTNENRTKVQSSKEGKSTGDKTATGQQKKARERVTPKTDISGRFNSAHPIKIFRDSGQGSSYGGNRERVIYPSCGTSVSVRDQSGSDLNCRESQNSEQYEHPPCAVPMRPCTTTNTRNSKEPPSDVHCLPPLPNQRYNRRGLHIESRPGSKIPHPTRSESRSLERPALPPHLAPRMSRTPPPIRTPRSSSSSEAIQHLRLPGSSTSSTGSTTSSDGSRNSSSMQHVGDASAHSDKSALERTKEYFKRENKHMNDLLRVWEAKTRPRKMVIEEGRGRSRSRMWLSHQRSRRRLLCLQQENQFANSSASNASAVDFESHASQDSPRSVLADVPQLTLTVGNRLPRPRAHQVSQAPNADEISPHEASVTSQLPKPIRSKSRKHRPRSGVPQNALSDKASKSSSREEDGAENYCMESDHSDVSISSVSSRSSDHVGDGKSSVSLSLSNSVTSFVQPRNEDVTSPPSVDSGLVNQVDTTAEYKKDFRHEENIQCQKLNRSNAETDIRKNIRPNLSSTPSVMSHSSVNQAILQSPVSETRGSDVLKDVDTLQNGNAAHISTVAADASLEATSLQPNSPISKIDGVPRSPQSPGGEEFAGENAVKRTPSYCPPVPIRTTSLHSHSSGKYTATPPRSVAIEIPDVMETVSDIYGNDTVRALGRSTPGVLVEGSSDTSGRDANGDSNGAKAASECIEKITSRNIIPNVSSNTVIPGKSVEARLDSTRQTASLKPASSFADSALRKPKSFHINSAVSRHAVMVPSGLTVENECSRPRLTRDVIVNRQSRDLVYSDKGGKLNMTDDNNNPPTRDSCKVVSKLSEYGDIAVEKNAGSQLDREELSTPPSSPLSVIVPPLDFTDSESSNGDNEYLSLPNSPCLHPDETDLISKMDDFNAPASPRFYTLHPNTFKKHPPDRPTPRTALRSATDKFFYEDDYESFSSSDDNDEFWKVNV